MNTHSPEEIAEAKAALPIPIQDFLNSTEFKKIIYDMGTRYTLTLQGVAELTDVVTMTVLGLESQDSFPAHVAEAHTHLDMKKQHELIAEIDARIFNEIKIRLRGPGDLVPEIEL